MEKFNDWLLVQHTHYIKGNRWHFLHLDDLDDYKNLIEDGVHFYRLEKGLPFIQKEDTVDYEGITIQPPKELIEFVKKFISK